MIFSRKSLTKKFCFFTTNAIALTLTACDLPISDVLSSSTQTNYSAAPPTSSSGGSSGIDDEIENPPEDVSSGAEIDPWDFPYDEGSNPYDQVTDQFDVTNKAKAVDVLFVMDNSGSMAEEQQSVVDSFSTFLEGFTAERIDYHIGIVSTDSTSDASWWTKGAYTNFPNAGPGSLLAYRGNNRFIRTEDGRSEALRQFRQNALLGTNGSGAETGLLAATKALKNSMITTGGWNEGFLRKDSLIEIVIVSDEDESIGDTDPTYLKKSGAAAEKTRIDNFANRLKNLRPDRPDQVRVDFVIAPPSQECKTALQKGETYEKAYSALNPTQNPLYGKILNICTNFAPELGALGAQIAVKVERRFKVSKRVDGALKVKLDGVELDVSTREGYTFNSSTGEIELHGLDLENRDQFAVTVEYVTKR